MAKATTVACKHDNGCLENSSVLLLLPPEATFSLNQNERHRHKLVLYFHLIIIIIIFLSRQLIHSLREISKVKTIIRGLQNINSPYNNFILLKCCSNQILDFHD